MSQVSSVLPSPNVRPSLIGWLATLATVTI